MRLAFVADGRSPTARSWMDLFVQRGHSVHLISTFQCEPQAGLASYTFLPVAFSSFTRDKRGGDAPGGASGISMRGMLRHWAGPFTIPGASRRLRVCLDSIEPEILHALRIPFEGMLAAAARPSQPLVTSVWGNDFTLHAGSSPLMARNTRRTLRRAIGLHTDCARDARLAREWGYPPAHPVMILPGSGGIDETIFFPAKPELRLLGDGLRAILREISPDAPVLVNPRGFRSYIRNDTFFQAIPLILREEPETIVLCPAMAGVRQAQDYVRELRLEESVRLLPRLEPQELAAVFQRSWIMISPSEHDGTPNSFLEAIACGCYPIVSDLESLREWIDDGQNGSLTSASDPAVLAKHVLEAIRDPALRERALLANLDLIGRRASRVTNAARAESFYQRLLSDGGLLTSRDAVEIKWP